RSDNGRRRAFANSPLPVLVHYAKELPILESRIDSAAPPRHSGFVIRCLGRGRRARESVQRMLDRRRSNRPRNLSGTRDRARRTVWKEFREEPPKGQSSQVAATEGGSKTGRAK